MKGYNRRRNRNGGRAQRIADNRERRRQEREAQRKADIEKAKNALRILNKYPTARIETQYGIMGNQTAKLIYEKYLKDNGEPI